MERKPRRRRVEKPASEFEESVVAINRVTKVVKGGRRFRFSALVVVGDRKGRVGFGTGKANEVPDAIRKAIENAKNNLITVPIVNQSTLPHEVLGRYGAGKVVLRPASEGTGVIAGGAVRPVLELAGIKNVTAKTLGSRNNRNVVLTTMAALKEMRTAAEVAEARGITVEQLFN